MNEMNFDPCSKGELMELGGNTPLLLDDINFAWKVTENKVNIFAVSTREDETKDTRYYICTVEKGGVFLGVKPAEHLKLMAVGEIGTKVIKLDISQLDEKLLECVDRWLHSLGKGIAKKVLSARRFHLITEGENIEITKDQNCSSPKKVLWIKQLEGSLCYYRKRDSFPLSSDHYYPVSSHLWIHALETSKVNAVSTNKCYSDGNLVSSLNNFHDIILRFLRIILDRDYKEEKESIIKKEKNEDRIFSKALTELAYSIEPQKEPVVELLKSESPLFKACQLIADKLNLKLREPSVSPKNGKEDYTISDIAVASKIRTRKVGLKKDWWKKDTGALLGFLKKNDQPVALLPTSPTSYKVYNPADDTNWKVNEKTASEISEKAFVLYRPFPNRELSLWDLVMFGMNALKGDLKTFIYMGIAAGLLGMVLPIATGIIFDDLVPYKATNQLYRLGLALFFCSLSAAMFQLMQSISLIRIEGRLKAVIQSALWDRILSFPCSFFKKFTAGDLAQRSLGIDTIMNQVFEGLIIPSILGAVYASFNFILLFFYDSQLALVSTVLSFVVFVAVIAATVLQLSNKRKETDLQGNISGFVFQLISGINKIKVAGAEIMAFGKWAERFSDQKKYAFKAGVTNNYLTSFNSVMPVISSITIFSFVTLQITNASAAGGNVISTGAFLAFNAAFTGFLAAIMKLGTSVATLSNVVPLFERMKPIFQTLQEVDIEKQDPGSLSGYLEMNNVYFRYREDGPLILKNVSFNAVPGEFIAFVGPSGSGKSTILRHLLGFETPEQGAVYYDGKDLDSLDLSMVRKQIGVVLQDSQLMAGEIYYNIVGSSMLTIDDAWEAAKMAGIDEDIKAMPMGMHTYVSEGGQTFSGGQKQRLLIARALAKKPGIILFDEATSALDNQTQNIITESINKLKATRIVIAHRLSTIIRADRIYVVVNGEIVQSGTYEELIKVEGAFKKIAERQLI